MTWESFYLVCFVAGFTLSVLALLAGACLLYTSPSPRD